MRDEGVDQSGAARADQQAVRRHNLSLVLRLVVERGPRSRATLAAETGLNKSTISSLAAELIERGLLLESGTENPGAVGRPARRLELAGDGIATLGLEVNEFSLAALATDLTGNVRYRSVVDSDNRASSATKVLGRLARIAEEAIESLRGQGLTPAGATVALPGLVDISRGMLFVAPNLGWEETPVVDLLHERLGRPTFPIRADNDANLAGLAEIWEGAGRSLRSFVYLYGAMDGSGVGGCLVLNGELFRGADGFGGELGHLTIDPNGRRCLCGSAGCLEVYAGERRLLERAGIEMPTRRRASHDDLDLVARRARRGDPDVRRALDEAAAALAVGASSLANLLNPDALVLGGTFAPVAEWLVEPIRERLRARVLGARWAHCQVLVSQLGEDAALRGAAALSVRELLADPGGFSVGADPAPSAGIAGGLTAVERGA